MKNIYLDSAKDYIKFMGNILYENKYVKTTYVDDVLIRENMSSTAFNNNVAIPHSMKMDALKTGVCLIVNDKPVKWGREKVQIIAMIPINEKKNSITYSKALLKYYLSGIMLKNLLRQIAIVVL